MVDGREYLFVRARHGRHLDEAGDPGPDAETGQVGRPVRVIEHLDASHGRERGPEIPMDRLYLLCLAQPQYHLVTFYDKFSQKWLLSPSQRSVVIEAR